MTYYTKVEASNYRDGGAGHNLVGLIMSTANCSKIFSYFYADFIGNKMTIVLHCNRHLVAAYNEDND